MFENLKKAALDYHELPTPGKISTNITKPTESQQDLSLAYTPGVAEPVRAIAENPDDAYRYTAKGNLVGVITDGTAVLGLGDVGPLASKPVMEGKAVLFKRFADIDVFDIEVPFVFNNNSSVLTSTKELLLKPSSDMTFSDENLRSLLSETIKYSKPFFSKDPSRNVIGFPVSYRND